MFNNNNSNNRAQQQADPNEESFDEEYSGSEGEEVEEEETFPETDQTLEYQQSLLTPDIYEHPIFSFKEDALLGPLGDLIKSLLIPFPDSSNLQPKLDMFKAFLFTSILGNKQISQLKKDFKKLGLESKTSCGNLISLDEISFRCLDCEIISSGAALTSLFCSKCFDNSNHNGHRVVVVKLHDENTGYCDCGDSDMVKPEGFCPNHKRIEVNREVELKKFPSVLVNTCQSILCKAFYGLAACFEIAEKLGKGNSYQAVVSFGQKFSDEVLGFIENGYTGISNSFLLVLNTVLESHFQAPYNQVWHNCDCLKHEVNNSEPKTSHSCKCSILSILLRYCVFLDKGDQSKIKKVLTECMKEMQFKNFVGIELMKNLQFLFPLAHLTDHDSIRKNPNLTTANVILSSTEDLVIKMIRSEHFKNVVEVIKNTINNYSQISERMLAAANLFEDLTVWFSNPEFKISTQILISETSIVTEILDILLTFQMKFYYTGETGLQLFDHNVDYLTMSNTLRIQKRVSKWIENTLKFISTRPKDEKDAFFKVFAKEWYVRYQTAIARAEVENGLCLTPVFERLLCYTLRSYEYQISQESIMRFFAEYLPEVKVEELAVSVIAGILKCFGFIRYLGGVVDTEMEKLFDGYYIFGCVFYEVDVVTVQKMIPIADPKNILEVIGDNFFSYDQGLKGTWKDLLSGSFNPQDEHLKKKLTIMKDFLTYLVYLMNDELCLLNMNTRTASSVQRDNDPNNLRIVEKAALNVLLSEYWTEYGFLKENMSNSILLDDSVISKVIPKISEHNEKEQKIRIKDELVMELDPYIFYKTPLLQADIINHAESRIEKNPNIDIVGGKAYTDLQEHLGVIKEKLFQSNLPEVLSHLIISSSNKEELVSLIPTALKLILLNLQCCGNEKYLSSVEFSAKLAELQKKEDLKECKLCIQKIQNIIREMKGEDENNLLKHSLVDEAENKKKAAQEKMNKLKEEFAKKQALFADKNKEIIGGEEGESPEVEKETALTCPHCMARIDEKNDTYGMPIFIAYTNNYKAAPGLVIDDYTDLKTANWAPVLSSCYHSYHKKCFNEAFQNVRDSPEIEYLKNPVESYCSICKTLCNHFLIINEGAEKTEPENSEEPVSPMFSHGVCHKMRNLLNDQRWRIIMNKGQVVPIDSEEILRRMFKYFINMFFVTKKSHELQKIFELYLNFFKSLKRVDKNELNISGFIDEPLFLSVIQRMIGEGIVSDASADAAFANFLKTAPELLVDDKLATIALQSLVDNEKRQEYLRIQFRTLREYVEIRMLQNYIAVEGSKLNDLKGCASYYRNNLNLLSNLLLKTLGFDLTKFAFALYLNKCLLSDDLLSNTHAICHLLCHPMTRESMDNLLNLAQIPYTVESLLGECLENIEKNVESEYLLLNNFMKNHAKAIEGVPMVPPPTLGSQAVQLPRTFAEFNNTIYRRKCTVCKKYDGEKNMSFCLICGVVMCEGPCSKSKDKNARGNFNIHACLYHMGTAAYYHLFEPVISYVVTPFNVVTVTKSLYSDTFGQSIEEALDEDEKGILKLDFKDFVLNSKFVEELHHMVKHQELEKEYFKAMINLDEEQEIPQDGFL